MKTSDIRRVIDASLAGMKLTPEQRASLAEQAMREETPTPPRRKIPHRLILAAVIAALAAAAIVPAVGTSMRKDEVHDLGDTFELHLGVEEDMLALPEALEVPEFVGEIWGEEFRRGLCEMKGMALLPRWVPEGYHLVESTYDTVGNAVFSTLRNDAGQAIMLNVIVELEGFSSSTTVQLESEEGTAETWAYGGIRYYYTTNIDRNSVDWIENNCLVHLSGPLDRTLMRRMIESIYGESPADE